MGSSWWQLVVLFGVSLASGALGVIVSAYCTSRQADRTLQQQAEQFEQSLSAQQRDAARSLEQQADEFRQTLATQTESLQLTLQQQERELQTRDRQSLRDRKAERLRACYVKLIRCSMEMQALFGERAIQIENEPPEKKRARLNAHGQREFEFAMDANAELAVEVDAKPVHEVFWAAQKKFVEYQRNLAFLYDERFKNEKPDTERNLKDIEQELIELLNTMEVAARNHLDQLQQPFVSQDG